MPGARSPVPWTRRRSTYRWARPASSCSPASGCTTAWSCSPTAGTTSPPPGSDEPVGYPRSQEPGARRRPPNAGEMMIELVLKIVLVLTSAILIVLILLHRGKGGCLSSMFGGAVSSSLAGSSVVEKNLNRLTVFWAVVWGVSTVALGILLKVS